MGRVCICQVGIGIARLKNKIRFPLQNHDFAQYDEYPRQLTYSLLCRVQCRIHRDFGKD